MLSLSQSVGYAVQALSCLESGCCQTRFVREVAKCSGVPPAYLAKLFTRLVEAGVLESKRGTAGGTRLARPASQISLYEISDALEGEGWLSGCLLGQEECSDGRACPTHEFWKVERRKIEELLRNTSLADIIAFETKRKRFPVAKRPTPKCRPS